MADDPKTVSRGDEPSGDPLGKGRAAGGLQTWLLGTTLILFALSLAYLLACLWPVPLSSEDKARGFQEVLVAGFAADLSIDVRLILLVMVAGGLGSFVHAATSFGDFVGNEKLTRNWMWWYVLKPFIGMALAAVFYFAVRGGFVSGSTDPDKMNAFGIAALAAMVGMFSKQATDKLSEVFDTLFKTKATGGDAKRKDNLDNPLPVLADLDPARVAPQAAHPVIQVRGTGFVAGSVVRVNGADRATDFKGSTELAVTLLPADVAGDALLDVVVFNPVPGGGASAPLTLRVAAAD